MYKKKVKFENSFSKAQFEIIRNDKSIFVKKILNSPNIRDYESILKNNHLKKLLKIKNLKIQNIEIKNLKKFLKLKYYKSSYINGLSGELIIKNSGINEVNQIREFLISYFKRTTKLNKIKKIDKKIFINKLNSIENNIKINHLRLVFRKNKSIMKKKINKINFYPNGICHGDLTLSNLILEGKNIYLIDFLKTYNDSLLQDLSKIYQEFVLGWSARYLDENEKLRSKIFYKMIIDQNFFKLFPGKFLKFLNFEILMTLFRIFPYVDRNDQITINWLSKSVEKVLNNRSF